MAVDPKSQMSDELNAFQAARQQFNKIFTLREQLEVQLNENVIVKEELDLLPESAKTFKLIGPALMKIDLKEAKDNVNNRIKYIKEELKRHDKTLEGLKEKQEKHREAVQKIEQSEKAKLAAATS